MNVEKELKEIRIACKISDWFSVEQHVDYDFDLSLGVLFVEGSIVFYNGDIRHLNSSCQQSFGKEEGWGVHP